LESFSTAAEVEGVLDTAAAVGWELVGFVQVSDAWHAAMRRCDPPEGHGEATPPPSSAEIGPEDDADELLEAAVERIVADIRFWSGRRGRQQAEFLRSPMSDVRYPVMLDDVVELVADAAERIGQLSGWGRHQDLLHPIDWKGAVERLAADDATPTVIISIIETLQSRWSGHTPLR
jgi:hypothetical protein